MTDETDTTNYQPQISVYPVGVMSVLLTLRHSPPSHWNLRWHARNFRTHWRRRSYWNGFLAEVDYPPAGLIHTTCGKGWTRRSAARDLGLQLWKDNRR